VRERARNAWDDPGTAPLRLAKLIGAPVVLLTHSCTAALELAAILIGIEPGDEVIMPSFTFVSTANAVVLRGGVPVFVDIRADTLNLDEDLVEAAMIETAPFCNPAG
jgi:dTDP-4-amino-4,6-dideoxygalactose transaminase